jgi:hypothetical protein
VKALERAGSLRRGVLTLGLALVLLALFAQGASAVTPLGESWHRGAIVPAGSSKTYLEPGSDRALRALAATGSDHVNLYVEWFMRNRRSSTVRPLRGATPTDRSVLHAMRKARSLGMTPVISLIVRSRDGTWQARIDPRDRRRWYSSYRRMTRHYARLATRGRAGMMVLCAELESMTQQTGPWRGVIREARELFPGELTCSANATAGAERIRFWDRLDYIGISAYMGLSSEPNPSVDQLARAWRSRHVRDIKALQRREQTPVLFTEIGYGSGMYTARMPWASVTGAYSQEPQRRAYEAFYRVWSEFPWFRGAYWWRWSPGSYDPRDRSHSPRGKSAERVMLRWNSAR